MSLIRRSERRSWTPEPIIPPFPGTDVFGNATPTMDSAMRLSAVWACVRLVADTISAMPLHAYTFADGVRKLAPSGDPAWLTRPDGRNTQPDWVYMLVVSLMLRGVGVGEYIMRDSMGRPNATKWHNPDQLQFKTGSDGNVEVLRQDGSVIPSANLLLVHAYRMPGVPLGLSPIRYAASQLSTDAAVQQFALGYFKDALHPASVLTSDQPIDQDEARSVKERVMQSRGKREPLVLGANLKFTPISVSPEESQFLETQKWSVATICRIFGVPPEMVAAEAGNSMTYSNVEQRAIDFLTYTIQPWLTRIEAALAELLPGRQHLRFDTSALLRTDLQTQMTASAIGIASKQMTPDEARALRDAPPLTDDQKTLLDLIPMTVSLTGRPAITSPSKPSIVNFANPAEEDTTPAGGTSGPNA